MGGKRLIRPKRFLTTQTVRGEGTAKFPKGTKVFAFKGLLQGRTGTVSGHERRFGKVSGILVKFIGGRGDTVVPQSALRKID